MDLDYNDVLMHLNKYLGEEVSAVTFGGFTPVATVRGVLTHVLDVQAEMLNQGEGSSEMTSQVLSGLAKDEVMMVLLGDSTVFLPRTTFLGARKPSEEVDSLIANFEGGISIEIRPSDY